MRKDKMRCRAWIGELVACAECYRSFIPLLPGALRKPIESRDIVAMHARQVASDQIDLIRIDADELNHVGFIARPAGAQFQLHKRGKADGLQPTARAPSRR
jgi:hypothetical protein